MRSTSFEEQQQQCDDSELAYGTAASQLGGVSRGAAHTRSGCS